MNSSIDGYKMCIKSDYDYSKDKCILCQEWQEACQKFTIYVTKTSFQYFLSSKFSEPSKYFKKEGHTSAN